MRRSKNPPDLSVGSVKDTYDWLNPNLEASVRETQLLIAEGHEREIKRIIRQHKQQSHNRLQRN